MKKRDKIYYPKNQIITGLYTSGSELEDEDNNEYIGQYHSYINGAIYSGATYEKGKSIPLQKISDDVNPTNIAFTKLTNKNFKFKEVVESIEMIDEHRNLTAEELKNGYYIRYFWSRRNAKEFKEITKDSYEKLEKNKLFNKFFELFNIEWWFKNPKYDFIRDGITIFKGYEDENRRTLQKTNSSYSGFSHYLNY